MFHTYIRASSGNVVDFDRASFLMDRDLLNEALCLLMHENVRESDDFDISDGVPQQLSRLDSRAQLVWDRYCRLHGEKYGSLFTPDADPDWDLS